MRLRSALLRQMHATVRLGRWWPSNFFVWTGVHEMRKFRTFGVIAAMTAAAAVPVVGSGFAGAQDAGNCGSGGPAVSADQREHRWSHRFARCPIARPGRGSGERAGHVSEPVHEQQQQQQHRWRRRSRRRRRWWWCRRCRARGCGRRRSSLRWLIQLQPVVPTLRPGIVPGRTCMVSQYARPARSAIPVGTGRSALVSGPSPSRSGGACAREWKGVHWNEEDPYVRCRRGHRRGGRGPARWRYVRRCAGRR